MNDLAFAPEDTRSAKAEYLSFSIGGDEYSIDIMSVREIRSWTRVTTLPHAPDYVRGVINLRGTVLPVLDLGTRLGLAVEEPGVRSVIIVVDVNARVMGLRVDAVSDILSLPETALQSPPDLGAGDAPRFIKSLTTRDDRMVRILDLNAVIPTEEDLSP